MFYRSLLAVAVIFAASLPAFAQDWQFRWAKGQTFTYRIKHVTSVVEIVDNSKNTAQSSLDIANRWEVADVDAKGIAKYKWPERLEFIDELPINAARKEQKNLLRDRIAAKLAEEAPAR